MPGSIALAGSARITICGPLVTAGASRGSSIAVSGVCLTVTETDGDQFTADVMGETLARSTLGALSPGGPVNLERPVPAGGRLDGHMVQGHVDGTGVITESRPRTAGGCCGSRSPPNCLVISLKGV